MKRADLQGYIAVTAWLVVAGAVLLLSMIPLIWAPGSLLLPMGRDQGIFAWVGEVILAGGLPYADAWEVKGPVSHFSYALAFLVFGKSEFAVRAFDLVVNATGVLAAARIGEMAGRKWVGLSAAGFAISLSLFNYWESAQPDGWAAIILLWSVVLLAQPRLTRGAMAGAGVLLGLAILIKPHYGLFGVLHLVRIAMATRKEERLPLFLATAAGVLLPAAICLSIYAAAGKLQALWDVFIRFNLDFHAAKFSVTRERALRQLYYLFVRPEVIVAAICAGMAVVNFRRADRLLATLLPLGVAIGLAVALVQGKFWIYHFLAFDLFLGVMAALGVASLADALRGNDREPRLLAPFLGRTERYVREVVPGLARIRDVARRAAIPAISALVLAEMLVFVAFTTAERMTAPWAYAAGTMSEEKWQAQFCGAGWDFCHGDLLQVADLIKRETRPGTPIFVWGFDALLYVLADRPASSRLGYSYSVLGGDEVYRRGVEAELMHDLDRRKPAFIVVQTNENNDLLVRSSETFLPEFPALQEMIATQYGEVLRNGSFVVYRART